MIRIIRRIFVWSISNHTEKQRQRERQRIRHRTDAAAAVAATDRLAHTQKNKHTHACTHFTKHTPIATNSLARNAARSLRIYALCPAPNPTKKKMKKEDDYQIRPIRRASSWSHATGINSAVTITTWQWWCWWYDDNDDDDDGWWWKYVWRWMMLMERRLRVRESYWRIWETQSACFQTWYYFVFVFGRRE